jgi:hypothetical protein
VIRSRAARVRPCSDERQFVRRSLAELPANGYRGLRRCGAALAACPARAPGHRGRGSGTAVGKARKLIGGLPTSSQPEIRRREAVCWLWT